eukprot:scpid71280/ scgid1338/ 
MEIEQKQRRNSAGRAQPSLRGTRYLLAFLFFAGTLCWVPDAEGRKAAGTWLSQKEVDKRVKETDFRVAIVMYAAGDREEEEHGDIQSTFEEASHSLSRFAIKSYKVNCKKNTKATQCQADSGDFPLIVAYSGGTSQTRLSEDVVSKSVSLVAAGLQSMLLNFKMGSGNLLQYVSTRSQLDNVKSKRDKVAVFATGDYHGEGHQAFLEAAYYFLSSRHGYKMTLVVTDNMDLCQGDAQVSTRAVNALWASHLNGEHLPRTVNGYYGQWEPQGMLSFFFGSILANVVEGDEVVDDEMLLRELTVHNDFGLTLAILPCNSKQYSTALRVLFTDMNRKFQGSIAGIYVNLRRKNAVSQFPEVEALVEESRRDESLRKPLIILRPGAKDGKRPDPVAVFNMTYESVETAYRSILPTPPTPPRTIKKPKAKKKKKAAPKAKPLPDKAEKVQEKVADIPEKVSTKDTEQERHPPLPDKPKTAERKKENLDTEGKPDSPNAKMETSKSPERERMNKAKVDDRDSEKAPEWDDDMMTWNKEEEEDSAETTFIGNSDDVAYLSERINRFEQLLRIRPTASLPLLRAGEMARLHEIAPLVVVLYYTPYTSPSRVFRVVMSDVAGEFKGREAEVAFRAINCAQLVDVCNRQDVRHTPSIAFVTQQKGSKAAKHVKYRDYLDYGTVFKTINLRLQPAVKQLSTRQQLIDLILKQYGSMSETVAVALLSSGQLTEFAAFSSMAGKWKGRFLFVNAVGDLLTYLLEKHNARVPALLLLKPRDLAEPAKLMPGKFTEDNMKTFFKQGTQPRMGQLTPANAGRLLDEGKTLFVYIGQLESPKANASTPQTQKQPYWAKLLQSLKAVALEPEFEAHYCFVWLSKSTPGLDEIQRSLNIGLEDASATLISMKAESAFEFSGSPSKKAIRDFLTSFDEGRAYPTGHMLKSDWKPRGKATDFLSKSKLLPFWKTTDASSRSIKDDETISESNIQRSRIRVASPDDEDLEADEIEDLPTDRDVNTAPHKTVSKQRDEL